MGWKPDYTGYGHRTRLCITVWGMLRHDYVRWNVRCRIGTCIRHPRCILTVLRDSVRGWRYAGTIHRFERMAVAIGNGPIPQNYAEWDDFKDWFFRMVPRSGTLSMSYMDVQETPAERVRFFCGKEPREMSDEELFKVASSMFNHYSDRMYPSAFNGARLCLETVMDRQNQRSLDGVEETIWGIMDRMNG